LGFLPTTYGDWRITNGSNDKESPYFIAVQSEKEIAEVTRHFDRENLVYQIRPQNRQESLGFIVVSRAFSDQDDASDDLELMEQRGVRDFLFVYRGDYANRISAGVYAARSIAQRRADNLNNAGFNFEVMERFRTHQAWEIQVLSPGLTEEDLRTILSGGPRPQVIEPPKISDTAKVSEPLSLDAVEAPLAPAPAEVKAVPTRPEPHRPVVTRTTREESSTIWYLLLAIIAVGLGTLALLKYHHRARRIFNQPNKTVAARVKEPVRAEAETTQPPEQALSEYAESVLNGSSAMTGNSSLTILGTEDKAIAELIQDLLLLTRLDDRETSLENYTFTSESLIEDLIARFLASAQVPIVADSTGNLPTAISMDAGKLSRILSILLGYVVARTETGVIRVFQDYNDGQLQVNIGFHPIDIEPEGEIAAITNPASSNNNLGINDRVRFGVANRLATAINGRIDTDIEQGEATITLRCPAVQVEKAPLMLPAGKTLDALLRSEARAKEEVEAVKVDAQQQIDATRNEADRQMAAIQEKADQRVQASEARARDIEDTSSNSIQELESLTSQLSSTREQLKEELSGLEEQYSALITEHDHLKDEANRTSAYAETQSKILETALADTQRASKFEDAARKVTEHLKGKVRNLEKQIEAFKNAENPADASSEKAYTSAIRSSARRKPNARTRNTTDASTGMPTPKSDVENVKNSTGTSRTRKAEAENIPQYRIETDTSGAKRYENFLSRLGTRLLDIEVALLNQDYGKMTKICRWIRRYSASSELSPIHQSANSLQSAIDSEDAKKIRTQLDLLIGLFSRIEIVSTGTSG